MEATTPITSCVERTPFKGLVLGAQLGKGAFGRVYKGYYNGKVIAVKVLSEGSEKVHRRIELSHLYVFAGLLAAMATRCCCCCPDARCEARLR